MTAVALAVYRSSSASRRNSGAMTVAIPLARRHGALISLLLTIASCAHDPARRNYVVSSERSDYAPAVRLAVDVTLDSTAIVVRVDSGSVVAPGPIGGLGA